MQASRSTPHPVGRRTACRPRPHLRLRPVPRRSTVRTRASPFIPRTSRSVHGWAFCFQFEPLFVSQLAADTQKHARIGFFELGTRLGDTIDLRQKFILVWRISGHQRLHDCLFLLNRSEQVNQLEARAVKNLVHLFLLIVRQAEFLDELGVVPPASRGTHAQGSPRTSRSSRTAHTMAARTAGALLRRTVRTARGGLLSKTRHSEQER